jgi:hypothetical protein
MKHLARQLSRICLSFFTGYALACFFVAVAIAIWPCLEDNSFVWVMTGFFSLCFLFLLYLPGRFDPEKDRLLTISRWCFLVLLPCWGFAINWSLHDCEPCRMYPSRALQTPDVIGLYVLYFAALIAYAISRRQPRPLRSSTELWINVFLLIGVIVCLSLVVQFGFGVMTGLIFGFIGLPLVAPIVVLIYFSAELVIRMKRRFSQERTLAWFPVAFWTSPVLCVWAALHRLIFGAFPWNIFTQTCEWTLSLRLPFPGDCHYLCTVAAQGSHWLVQPLRLGRRHGREIIVNRQLCVANAFEDLLHSRWPRFGRFCRKTYDKLGLPVSRLLHSRPLANLTYLLMKPAEWLFSICLLLFDSQDPERRIDRMYR